MNNYIYKKMTFSEINETLKNCSICVLSVIDQQSPYLLPMYFTYDSSRSEPLFILESKDQGQKIQCLHHNDQVGIFVQYNEADAYKSIVACGKATITCNNTNSYKNMIKIKVKVQQITGRIYCK